MKWYDAAEAFRLVEALSSLGTYCDVKRINGAPTGELHTQIIDQLRKAKTASEYVGLKISIKRIDALLGDLMRNPPKPFDSPDEYLGHHLSGICEIMRDELELHKFLFVAPECAALIEDAHPFGVRVSEVFPSLAYDVSEAAKCLGLSRSTAAVMHLARVGEVATRLLAHRLDIAEEWTEHKGSEAILREAGRRIDARKGASKSPQEVAELEFLADVSGRLKDAKDAWRNAAMHARSQKYTEQEARDIYDAMGRLMRSLAKRLSEQEADLPEEEG